MRDKVIETLIRKEIKRQQETINLIPSENYVSGDVLEIIGSPLTNKYSEGYPGKRYYPGNQYYDEIEKIAQERALKCFGLQSSNWHVNVQPYSGSPANIAIYNALMNFGDTLMGLKLTSGGHLTHGHKVNFSGRAYNVVHYGVDEKTGLLDYEEISELAQKHKPKVIVSGLTAYPRKIDFKKFGEIAKSVGAYHVADISHIAGLIAAGLHQSPFPYSDVVMTTTHKTLRGPRGAIIFSQKHNPNDTNGSENSDKSSQHSDYVSIAERIDRAVFPGLQGGPHNNIIAAEAVMFFEALKLGFRKYQQQIIKNAQALSKALTKKGLKLVTGGTDNHLMLVDLRSSNLGGLEAEKILEENNITANRNTIPGDASPFKPSGLRMGTPAVTTRGMKEKEMEQIADLIYRALVRKEHVGKEILTLCKKFPLPYQTQSE
jgi:glycine hydroxymethyltransferase